MNNYRVNNEITVEQVRLINSDGEQVGVVSITEALNQAYANDMDLVEINEKADPPVVKIMDYGKFKYELQKAEKAQAKKQRNARIVTKELWFRPCTNEHDIDVKVNKAKGFLNKGYQVKFGIKYRGREVDHINEGNDLLKDICSKLDEIEFVEHIAVKGSTISTVIKK